MAVTITLRRRQFQCTATQLHPMPRPGTVIPGFLVITIPWAHVTIGTLDIGVIRHFEEHIGSVLATTVAVTIAVTGAGNQADTPAANRLPAR